MERMGLTLLLCGVLPLKNLINISLRAPAVVGEVELMGWSWWMELWGMVSGVTVELVQVFGQVQVIYRVGRFRLAFPSRWNQSLLRTGVLVSQSKVCSFSQLLAIPVL